MRITKGSVHQDPAVIKLAKIHTNTPANKKLLSLLQTHVSASKRASEIFSFKAFFRTEVKPVINEHIHQCTAVVKLANFTLQTVNKSSRQQVAGV